MVTQNHLNGQDKDQIKTQPVQPEPVTFANGFEPNGVASSDNGTDLVQAVFADFTRGDSRKAHLDNAVITQAAPKSSALRPWQRLSLRSKATFLAIAIGTIPVLGIGATAYYFGNQSITRQIKQEKQERATEIADKINRFMFERQADIQIMATLLPNVNALRLSKIAFLQDQEAKLNHFIEVYKFYDSIALFDLNGNVIVKSQGQVSGNIKNRTHFQIAIKTDRPFIDQPEVSPTTRKTSIYIAGPVKDAITGRTYARVI